MKRSVSIVHILDVLSYNSGVSSVVMDYIRYHNSKKTRMDVVVHKTSNPILIEEVRRNGGEVFTLPDIARNTVMEYSKKLKELFLKNNYSIVHCHTPNSAFLSLRLAKKTNIPQRIIHAHSTKYADVPWKSVRNKILVYPLPLWANHYFATSLKAAKKFYRGYVKKAHIIPNGIDYQKFAYNSDVRAKMRMKYNISNQEYCIGHVGRLSPVKNHKFMIQVFSSLQKKISNSKLIFVGDGPLLEELKKFSKELEMEEHILFVGAQQDISQFYQMFDLFWMSSLFEGWGLAALEAQAAGLPTILSQNITPEIKIYSDCLFLPIDIHGREQWTSESIRFLLSQSERENSHKNINEKYQIRQQVASLEKLYFSMI